MHKDRDGKVYCKLKKKKLYNIFQKQLNIEEQIIDETGKITIIKKKITKDENGKEITEEEV